MAQWRLLTDYLRDAGDEVTLTWSEFDEIVRGVPPSAVDHYPQWWHGDRSHVHAWRTAGYKATRIDPGVAVSFVRTDSATTDVTTATSGPSSTKSTDATFGGDAADALDGLDPDGCLVVIPCSASKRTGGQPSSATPAAARLAEARSRVLANPATRTDESAVMPAWQRYDGHLYRAAGPVLSDLAASRRLVIVSGGYGLLDGGDLIGDYDRMMRTRDWPKGLLEELLAERAAESGLDVMAFVSSTTDYAKVIRRTRWRLAAGCSARLVTLRGVRGASVVSGALGLALRTFVERRGDYPPGTVVERLDT